MEHRYRDSRHRLAYRNLSRTNFSSFLTGPLAMSDLGRRPSFFYVKVANSAKLARQYSNVPWNVNGREETGGERGIRTPGPREGSAVFKTAPFGHSGISPPGYRILSTGFGAVKKWSERDLRAMVIRKSEKDGGTGRAPATEIRRQLPKYRHVGSSSSRCWVLGLTPRFVTAWSLFPITERAWRQTIPSAPKARWSSSATRSSPSRISRIW